MISIACLFSLLRPGRELYMCFCRTLLAGSGLPKTSHVVLFGFVAIIILMCSEKKKKKKREKRSPTLAIARFVSSELQ